LKRSLFFWLGSAAALVIVVASLVLRSSAPADPLADVARQRADVTRFHDLVKAGRWDEVYRSTTEPPTDHAASFVKLMQKEVRKRGKVTSVHIDSLRLLRSRTVPLLEVHETVEMTTRDGGTLGARTVSYFARRGTRWLFAFSASLVAPQVETKPN
jgi:hypothetical protein